MVNDRDVPISVEELHEKLLNRENALATVKETTDASMPITVNAAQYLHHSTPRPNSHYRGTASHTRGNYRNAKPYLSKCQICGTQGHKARRCPQFMQVMPSSSHGRGVPQWYHQPQQTPIEYLPKLNIFRREIYKKNKNLVLIHGCIVH
ncbi:hypothetical protein N665_1819s0008 [Sinapis alba]|nr:hypothetical protein N665_1819s0008 [Sinapis alba]